MNIIELIKQKPWLSERFKPVGNSIWHVPTMITKEEKLMLAWLAENYVEGAGQVVDLGSFLGGSSVFLAHGLNQNKKVNKISTKVHCYDVFFIPPRDVHVIDYFFSKNNLVFPSDGNILPFFEKATKPYQNFIVTNKGRIEEFEANFGDIELLFVDLMKSPVSYNHVVKEFFTALIPGKSLVILQDYLYKNSGAWHAILMEKLSDHFEYIVDTQVNSVVFLHTKALSKEILESCLWENISFDEKVALMEKAKKRWNLIPHIEIIENQLTLLKTKTKTKAIQ